MVFAADQPPSPQPQNSHPYPGTLAPHPYGHCHLLPKLYGLSHPAATPRTRPHSQRASPQKDPHQNPPPAPQLGPSTQSCPPPLTLTQPSLFPKYQTIPPTSSRRAETSVHIPP